MPSAISRSDFLDGGVHPGLAVHAHHAEIERMRRREAADAEQRHRDRNLRLLGERLQRRFGAAEDDAVAGENQRPLRGVDQRERIDAARMTRTRRATRDPGAAASQSNSQTPSCASLVMSISTGPGPAARGDRERLANRPARLRSARVTRKLCLVIGSVMPVMSVS